MNTPPRFSPPRQAAGLAAWLLLVYLAAALGGLGSVDAGPFYLSLQRPSWAPPPWLFGPAWALLYTLMGISAWLVWRQRAFAGARVALTLFLGQLALNSLWSWLFFKWRLGGLAFAEIVLLWILILATTVAFARTSVLAAALLLPYLAWVAYAAALNLALWRLNSPVLG